MGPKKSKPSPQVGSRELVYENRYQQVYRVTADFGDFRKEYFVTDAGQRAAVVVARNDSILMVRQYRLLIDGLSCEIPGGKVDTDETPEAAAARECLEETGVNCRNLKPLLYSITGLDTFYNPTHLFYTDEFTETPGESIHGSEVYDHIWLPLRRLVEMVFTREIVDNLSIMAILAYQTLSAQR